MIRFIRPDTPPDVLIMRGVPTRDALCVAYDAGEREFSFDATIYRHASVIDALIAAQSHKCCFCERHVGKDGDVEHFRPKAGCSQSLRVTMLRPGYYWLAYEWRNLFLSCGPCNSRNKRNLFPLADDTLRARCHTDDLTRESPLFLNPAEEDPELFIGWRDEVAYAINGNARAKATIDALGLNRPALRDLRRQRLEKFQAIQTALKEAESKQGSPECEALAAKLRDWLTRHHQDTEEFAAMYRAALRTP